MSMRIASRRSPSAEMNVTPLIDILLVLLIIFMTVLPHHYRGEKAEIPHSTDTVKPPSPGTVVVELHDNGEGQRPTLTINQEEVSWQQLEPRLKEILLPRVERVAFMKGDPELDFEYVAQAVEIVHRAGAERVGLMGMRD